MKKFTFIPPYRRR